MVKAIILVMLHGERAVGENLKHGMLCSQMMMCNFVVHARYAGWGHAAANVQKHAISRCQLRIRNVIVHARFVAWGVFF